MCGGRFWQYADGTGHTRPHSATRAGRDRHRPIAVTTRSGQAQLTWVNRAAPHARPRRIKCGVGRLGRRALKALRGTPAPPTLPAMWWLAGAIALRAGRDMAPRGPATSRYSIARREAAAPRGQMGR